jgi:hypothetical protein
MQAFLLTHGKNYLKLMNGYIKVSKYLENTVNLYLNSHSNNKIIFPIRNTPRF